MYLQNWKLTCFQEDHCNTRYFGLKVLALKRMMIFCRLQQFTSSVTQGQRALTLCFFLRNAGSVINSFHLRNPSLLLPLRREFFGDILRFLLIYSKSSVPCIQNQWYLAEINISRWRALYLQQGDKTLKLV